MSPRGPGRLAARRGPAGALRSDPVVLLHLALVSEVVGLDFGRCRRGRDLLRAPPRSSPARRGARAGPTSASPLTTTRLGSAGPACRGRRGRSRGDVAVSRLAVHPLALDQHGVGARDLSSPIPSFDGPLSVTPPLPSDEHRGLRRASATWWRVAGPITRRWRSQLLPPRWAAASASSPSAYSRREVNR
jgi:hypothetical protein